MSTDSLNFKSNLEWVRTQMPRVKKALVNLPDISGAKIACSLHLEMKMVPAFEALVERGASLYLTTCNPHTVKDDVVEHLSKQAKVNAWNGMDEKSWQKSLHESIDWQPNYLCEMGADLTRLLHEPGSDKSTIKCAIEATSSGISVLEKMTDILKYPVFNWNNVPIKEHIHNRRMVGITTWHTFYERTRLTLHEKRVVVLGYGAVGQSVADSAKAYGGNVCIVENDPGRAMEAVYAGWDVHTLDEVIAKADVIVTATGAHHVLGAKQFEMMKSGVFLLNVGHRNDEIDTTELNTKKKRAVIPFLDEYEINGRIIYLFAGGHMANLAAGYGDSVNAFDLTMAIMVSAIGYAIKTGSEYKPGLHPLPKEVWLSTI